MKSALSVGINICFDDYLLMSDIFIKVTSYLISETKFYIWNLDLFVSVQVIGNDF